MTKSSETAAKDTMTMEEIEKYHKVVLSIWSKMGGKFGKTKKIKESGGGKRPVDAEVQTVLTRGSIPGQDVKLLMSTLEGGRDEKAFHMLLDLNDGGLDIGSANEKISSIKSMLENGKKLIVSENPAGKSTTKKPVAKKPATVDKKAAANADKMKAIKAGIAKLKQQKGVQNYIKLAKALQRLQG